MTHQRLHTRRTRKGRIFYAGRGYVDKDKPIESFEEKQKKELEWKNAKMEIRTQLLATESPIPFDFDEWPPEKYIWFWKELRVKKRHIRPGETYRKPDKEEYWG